MAGIVWLALPEKLSVEPVVVKLPPRVKVPAIFTVPELGNDFVLELVVMFL